MSALEQLKLERSRIRRSFSNVSKKITGFLTRELSRNDLAELTSLFQLLTVRNDELTAKNVDILSVLDEEHVDEQEMNAEQDKVDEYLLIYYKYKTAIDNIVHNPDADSRSEVGSSSSDHKRKYKLPILQMKKFGGDLRDWLPFWSQFSKLDEDGTIDDVDKLGYLTQCMIEKSPAKELVDSYPATGAMYNSVVKALKERFGRSDLLTEFYIRELLKLIIQNTNCRNQLSISVLYDRLQCHLRNLETLGVTSDNCAPILMPLVSSCLPEEMLRIWERGCAPNVRRTNPDATSKDFLDSLLVFLRVEVEGEQKVELARTGFGLSVDKGVQNKSVNVKNESKVPPTAASLLTEAKQGASSCVFCDGSHYPQDCKTALDMSLEKRREKVSSGRACYCCLQQNHNANRCKRRPKCIICKKGHFVLMCDKLPKDGNTTLPESGPSISKDETLAAVVKRCSVLMQTLVVTIRGNNGLSRTARLLIDSASHRSYVLSKTAVEMGYAPCRQDAIQHSLFGGATTGVVNHNIYQLYLSRLEEDYHCNFEVLGQSEICGQISPVIDGPWIEELAAHNVQLSDTCSATDIEILVGADIAAKLWTGKRIPLACGLVAMETKLGWTLSGKVPDVLHSSVAKRNDTLATVVISMLSKEASITDLWTLDTLGITDPSGKTSRAEMEAAAQQHFRDTVSVSENGRFEVHLPWVESHPALPDNYKPSLKRLHSTVKRLKAEKYYDAYQGLLDEWLKDEVIEEVPPEELEFPCHYLPHRHVVKPNSTTPVRPVFDASARENRHPSLNMCLEKGPNLIEKIPSVLARFRMKKVGVVSDIRRAFLQIGVSERDRNFLRFLWLDSNGILKHYRHRRVVFGVSPSPFLLESCLKFHLDGVLALCEEDKAAWPISFIELLANSYYVDNCLASLENEDSALSFAEVASKVMAERQFELRGWEFSGERSMNPTNVLGLLWHKEEDVLAGNFESLLSLNMDKVTKKVMLSAAHRIFDPIGMFCAVALIPKLLVQQTWELGLTWDQEVNDELKSSFFKWFKEAHLLKQVRIPRWVFNSDAIVESLSLHVFSDACQNSYAAVVFLRVETRDRVRVQLMAAKARVAPSVKSAKGMTIPRLELLAAVIGARLHSTVVRDYKLHNTRTIFWTDASTVLAWILRSEPWDVFVMNRIKEIRELTEGCEWKHVPGTGNPADLPSRGCCAKKFLLSRWWEGPEWLRCAEDCWPRSPLDFDEEVINQEKKKGIVSSMVSSSIDRQWYYRKFSHYKMIVRTIAWIYRFKKNTKVKRDQRAYQDLTAEEYTMAECKVLSMVQEEAFTGVLDNKLKSLLPFIDKDGLIRLMTKISNRQDVRDFCHPIVLPSADHPVVHRLIMDGHRSSCHAGTQMLLAILRQRFWIIGGRQTIRSVLNSCMACKRQTAKKLEAIPAPLPESRVCDARIFEVTGVDLAGPLYLKTDHVAITKAWVCLFTCGVYRAVRLELVSSLSTDSFLQAFRRFCSKQGRPRIVYSDQGTNFVGFDNACSKLDWNAISLYSSARRIDWRFNPPASPWWGGWWERLVGVLKKLLRRVLGRSSVNFEEMQTILCDCETVINSRPLTYLSEDPLDLAALTPNMFLHDLEEIGMPDYDLIEASHLRKRLQYRHKLKMSLRQRFRTEYLGQLQLYANKNKQRDIKLGEIVLIGNDDSQRMDWPLGRVVDLIKGNDGNIRVVRVVTKSGELVRPVQRIHPLEIEIRRDETEQAVCEHLRQDLVPDAGQLPSVVAEDMADPSYADSQLSEPLVTRRGRLIQKPKRLDL